MLFRSAPSLQLQARGSRVETIGPPHADEHLFGPNAMNLSLRPVAARAGFEMALIDALARSQSTPVWSLFGGAGPRTFTTDLTITAGTIEHAAAAG